MVLELHVTGHLTSVHSVGKLDKNGMLLHDTLNMRASDTNDAFVVLVRDVERNRGWHLLLNKSQALLHRLVASCHNINVEVVLVEAVEDDLHVALMIRLAQRSPNGSNFTYFGP